MELSIIVDHREPQKIRDELQQLGVIVEVEQLYLGDYVLSDQVVIERKTGSDFVQSLYDNRLFEQAHRLIEEYDQVIYILEDFQIEPEQFKPIYGALAYLTIRKNIQTIPTTNKKETAAVIERLTSWVQEEHNDPILVRSGPKRMTTLEKQLFLVQGLEGVGDKTARLLLDVFGSPEKIFREIEEAKIVYTKTGNPKGITGKFAEIKGIGYKFVEKNKTVLMGDKLVSKLK